MKIHTLMTAVVLLASGAAFAQTTVTTTATPRIDARAATQQKRIDQGIASGSLTQTEAQRLEARQVRMKEAEARFKSDGVVTGKERATLTHMEDKNSKQIHRAKHNVRHAHKAS
jgi:hypothetical protein